MKCSNCANIFDCGTIRKVGKENKRVFNKFINEQVNCIDYEEKKQDKNKIEEFRLRIK